MKSTGANFASFWRRRGGYGAADEGCYFLAWQGQEIKRIKSHQISETAILTPQTMSQEMPPDAPTDLILHDDSIPPAASAGTSIKPHQKRNPLQHASKRMLASHLRRHAMRKVNGARLARGEITEDQVPPNGMKVYRQVPGKSVFSFKELYEAMADKGVQSQMMRLVKEVLEKREKGGGGEGDKKEEEQKKIQ